MGVALVVAEVLLRQLPVPVVVLLDTRLGVAVGIVLRELGGLVPAWQVVLRYLQIVVRVYGGVIPQCHR